MKTLFTLCLTSATIVSTAQQHMFSDEFNGTLLNPGWIIVSPNPDCQVQLTGAGELLLRASPLYGGSELNSGTNFNAPRILQPICGNWTIEAKYHANLTHDWQFAAILYSTDSAGAEETLDDTGYMRHGSPPAYCTGQDSYFLVDTIICRSTDDTVVWVRIEKSDTVITESVSFDSLIWQTRSGTELRDIRYIGPSCGRQAYDNVFTVYTNDFVEYFRFVEQDTLQISGADVICLGQPIELTVDTVPDGAYAWYGPYGDPLGSAFSISIPSAGVADSGWYHVIVSRLDCQFQTDSFLVVVDPCLGIATVDVALDHLILAPNPTSERLSVTLPIAFIGSLSVVDASRRILMQQPIHSKNGTQCEISLAHLAPGAYFVTLQGEYWEAHGRFIKE